MARPFLKWAGGKRQLLPDLLEHIRRFGSFSTYYEPFVGGGALFFELKSLGMLNGHVVLSDVNTNLVETYQGVANNVDQVIALLRDHADRHSQDYFYQVRATEPAELAERSARIIYLNRTCFNGLYRENSRGQFNVPFGRYVNPKICDEPNLRAVSQALSGVELRVQSFDGVLPAARPGDLVYFDPPYVPLPKTASFTSYAKNGFSMLDQRRLAEVFAQLTNRGVNVLLSNSKTPEVLELYAGFKIHTVMAARTVNSKANQRGKVAEVLVTHGTKTIPG